MRTSWFDVPHRLVATFTLIAAGLLAACAADQPTSITSNQPARAATGGTGASLQVTVLDTLGLPVQGLLVVPFDSVTGPYQNGLYTSQLTDATGTATFSGLGTANYCVTARSLPGGAASFLGGIVPPPSGTAPGTTTNGPVGIMTGAKAATVALTRTNFLTYCTTSQAPLALKGGKSVKLTMSLLKTAPASVSWNILGPTGATNNVPTWTVLDLPVPWAAGLGLPPDVRTGLLVATTAQNGNSARGLNPTDGVVVQTTLFADSTGHGLLTGTLHVQPNSATASVYVAPLVCVVDTSFESFGDGSSGGVDFGGFGPDNNLVKLGWGATQSLALNDSTLALWHRVRGTGTITLQIRFSSGPVSTISQDFDWNGTAWVKGSTQGVGSGPVTVTPFAALLADGSYRITWVVTGVDPSVTFVDMQLKTSGDQWPDASRQEQVSGFQRLLKPASSSSCKGGQGSDDRFWIG